MHGRVELPMQQDKKYYNKNDHFFLKSPDSSGGTEAVLMKEGIKLQKEWKTKGNKNRKRPNQEPQSPAVSCQYEQRTRVHLCKNVLLYFTV